MNAAQQIQLRAAEALQNVAPCFPWQRMAIHKALETARQDGLLCAAPEWIDGRTVRVHLAGEVEQVTVDFKVSL